MTRRAAAAVLMLAMAAALPGRAATACACCADRGERFLYAIDLNDWEISELAALRAASPARLFVSECGIDCVRGIADPQTAYDVDLAISSADAVLTMSDAKGVPRGTLTVEMPSRYTYFGVDIAPPGAADAPRLYTEMRLAGTVRGTGDFAGAGPVSGELVFAGFGGRCIRSVGFDRWSLTVSSPGVEFRFTGAVTAR